MRASPLVVAALLLCAGSAGAEEASSRVVLRWQSVQGAAGYDLQVARDGAFTVRELDVRVELAGYRLGPPPTSGRRYWRVRTVDADGRPGPWSSPKIIEPVPTGAPVTAPPPEPPLVVLDVPPVPPAPIAVEAAQPESMTEPSPLAELLPRAGEGPPLAPPTERGLEGFRVADVLRAGRPGLLGGWRVNLLGVTAPSVAAEVTAPFPWIGGGWWAALRAGWWRETTEVPISVGLEAPLVATADVVPIGLLLMRGLHVRWARLYAGAGAGIHLVVIRQGGQGSLDASGALEALVGAGRDVGPGEAFLELSGGLAGVEGPLGSLRTGGISLSVGYRLR